MSVVGYSWRRMMYVSSSDGSAGDRMSGVGGMLKRTISSLWYLDGSVNQTPPYQLMKLSLLS